MKLKLVFLAVLLLSMVGMMSAVTDPGHFDIELDPLSGAVHVISSNDAGTGNITTSTTVYVDGVPKYQVYSGNVDTTIPLTHGAHWIVIQTWNEHGLVQKMEMGTQA